jgi:hypothetical protein
MEMLLISTKSTTMKNGHNFFKSKKTSIQKTEFIHLDFKMSFDDHFWLEDPSVLIRNLEFIPRSGSTLEETMNILTRITILVFIILLISKTKNAVLIFLIALICISLLYYFQRKRRCEQEILDEHENYHESFIANSGNGRDEAFEVLNNQIDPKYNTRQPRNVPRPKVNPRRPYPPSIPTNFEVHAGNGYSTPANTSTHENSSRSEYLTMLRRRKEELEQEAEIAELENQLYRGSSNHKVVESSFQEEEDESEEELASRKFGGISRFVAANDDSTYVEESVKNVRLRHPRVPVIQSNTVDPYSLQASKQAHLGKGEQSIRNRQRQSHLNNI